MKNKLNNPTNSVFRLWSTKLHETTQDDYDKVHDFMKDKPIGVLNSILEDYPSDAIGYVVAEDILANRPKRIIYPLNK